MDDDDKRYDDVNFDVVNDDDFLFFESEKKKNTNTTLSSRTTLTIQTPTLKREGLNLIRCGTHFVVDELTRARSTRLLLHQGRGFENADIIDAEVKHSRNDRYDRLRATNEGYGEPQKSIEGWVVLATGVHEEAQEEDIHENFGDFGEISNVHLNLDRRTGFVKGYCLIEYKEKEEALRAIENMDGKLMLDQEVRVDWAFVAAPEKAPARRRRERDER